jgi:hypothetical protein
MKVKVKVKVKQERLAGSKLTSQFVPPRDLWLPRECYLTFLRRLYYRDTYTTSQNILETALSYYSCVVQARMRPAVQTRLQRE